MVYKDNIYGEVVIDEAVILELLDCPSIKRIDGVSQHGHYEPYFPNTDFSRLEHSMGVFVLLKKFGASLPEQISGLLHDVSHTVFSHVADYIFKDGSGEYQNFQDEELVNFIKNSEMPEILEKFSIDCDKIIENPEFTLKERDLPDLCADRIDYFLREAKNLKKVTQEEIDQFLGDFVIIKGDWVFKSREIAQKYAYLFLDVNNTFWSNLETGVMFKTMGELIKYCLEKEIIQRQDLFTTDSEVWSKIRPASKNDEKLAFLLDRADNKYKYVESDANNYDLYAQCKSRVVDPLFINGEELVRVSSVDEKFAQLKEKHSKPKEYYIKFLELRK